MSPRDEWKIPVVESLGLNSNQGSGCSKDDSVIEVDHKDSEL